MMFMQQLKIALINELMQFNDSSMDTLSITNGNGDDDNKEKTFQQEFIVSAFVAIIVILIPQFILHFVEINHSLFYASLRQQANILSHLF